LIPTFDKKPVFINMNRTSTAMKNQCFIIGFVILGLVSCNKNEIEGNSQSLNSTKDYNGSGLRPINMFEGAWLWIKTEGSGIAGPYISDPSTEGYSMIYDFHDFTNLVVYKNNIKKSSFSYAYIYSDTLQNKLLTLTDSLGSETRYLWNIITENSEDTLTFTNPLECCDNNFTMYFRRISYSDIQNKQILK